MERAEAHLPSYAFFCWCCVHLGCKISFDVSCADDMTGRQAGIELCAVPFFRQAFQVYDTLNTWQLHSAVHLVAGSTTSSFVTRIARTILARPLVQALFSYTHCHLFTLSGATCASIGRLADPQLLYESSTPTWRKEYDWQDLQGSRREKKSNI